MIFSKFLARLSDELKMDTVYPDYLSQDDTPLNRATTIYCESFIEHIMVSPYKLVGGYESIPIVVWSGSKYKLPYYIRKYFNKNEVICKKDIYFKNIETVNNSKTLKHALKKSKEDYSQLTIIIPYVHAGEIQSKETLKFCVVTQKTLIIDEKIEIRFFEKPISIKEVRKIPSLQYNNTYEYSSKLYYDVLSHDYEIYRKNGPSMILIKPKVRVDYYVSGNISPIGNNNVIKYRKVQQEAPYPIRINSNIIFHNLRIKFPRLTPLWRKLFYVPSNECLLFFYDLARPSVFKLNAEAATMFENMGVLPGEAGFDDYLMLSLNQKFSDKLNFSSWKNRVDIWPTMSDSGMTK